MGPKIKKLASRMANKHFDQQKRSERAKKIVELYACDKTRIKFHAIIYCYIKILNSNNSENPCVNEWMLYRY